MTADVRVTCIQYRVLNVLYIFDRLFSHWLLTVIVVYDLAAA